MSAADVLAKRLAPESLKGKIVLVGTTAPGLLDIRVTPVGEAYAGVETHANLISGLMDGRIAVKPDYALGYDVAILALAGLTLAFALPLLSAPRAVLAQPGGHRRRGGAELLPLPGRGPGACRWRLPW